MKCLEALTTLKIFVLNVYIFKNKRESANIFLSMCAIIPKSFLNYAMENFLCSVRPKRALQVQKEKYISHAMSAAKSSWLQKIKPENLGNVTIAGASILVPVSD